MHNVPPNVDVKAEFKKMHKQLKKLADVKKLDNLMAAIFIYVQLLLELSMC